MAERSSTRNRRNTPQSPPQSPSHRTNRATRSQSHDVSDGEAGSARAGRRSARQANVQGPQAVKAEGKGPGRKGKANAQTNAAPVDSELSMVAEESHVGYPDLAQAINNELAANENAIQETNQQLDLPGNNSALSGTTARLSNPAQDAKSSNVQEMLDTLPDLSDAADKLLYWLLPEDLSEDTIASIRADLQYPDSRISKNVKRLGNVFSAQKGIYGDFESYINIPVVVKALVGLNAIADINSVWRPEPLLHKANLTTLVTVITRSWSEKFNNEHFDFLESIFPAPFMTRSDSIDDLSVAVEIRTQHFIMLSSRYTDVPNFDPDMFLSQVFFNNPPNLKGWSVVGLRSEDLAKDHQAIVHRRLQDIRRNFSNGRAVDLPSLKSAYPWDAFVSSVINWSRARLDHIQGQIDSHGGVEAIVQSLSNESQSQIAAATTNTVEGGTSPLVELEYPSASEFSHTASDRSGLNRTAARRAAGMRAEKVKFNSPRAMLVGIETLRALEARSAIQGNSATPSAAPMAVMSSKFNQNGSISANAIGNTAESFMSGGLDADEWQPPQIEDDPMATEDSRRRVAASIVQHAQQLAAAQNKENIQGSVNFPYTSAPQMGSQRQALGPRKFQYIDPQPGAQSIAWSETGFSQDLPSTSRVAKRYHATVEDEEPEPSQDEGFQQDDRNQDVAEKRRAKPGPVQPRAAKRARMTENEPEDNVVNDIQAAVNDFNNANELPESTLGVYQSSHNRALNITGALPKKIQVRKAWTDDETGTLLDLIEEHGTSWRLLKEIDDGRHKILQGRDQVALKDKARNMKLDFLKAQSDLPANFEFVPLNKIQIQKLHDLGIDYNQDRGRRTTT